MTGTSAASASRAGAARRGWVLQLEDLALFLYVTIGEPVVVRLLGPVAGGVDPWSGSASGPAAALALLGAAAGTAACLVTRASGATDRLELNRLEGYARFPTIVLAGFLAAEGLEALGIATSEGFFFAIMIALGIPLAFYAKLPQLPTALRRLLMTPAILVGTTAFTGMAGTMMPDRVDLAVLARPDDPLFGLAVFVTSLLCFAVAAFYNFFVVCPRVVAGAGGGVPWWALRFGVFVAGLVLGVTVPV